MDIEDGGLNGMVVRSLTRGGPLARDGRLQPGDYLVNVNNENMRGVSQNQVGVEELNRSLTSSKILHF